MDRATNLEALTEEEEEQWDGGDGMSEASDLRRKEDPNQFDSLCDGVLNTLAIVHAALQEILELKDELLQHSLPPNALTKVALTTTRVFRSVSDMHMPVNELIRLVRLYSTPWEEKSTALKKLHEDYESKKTQLNIAIKRLQLVDAHSKRIAKERRIMSWEKVFAKLTAAKGHGRRWKFLIEGFKRRAAEGVESLQEYMDSMEASSDEDEADDDIATQMQRVTLVTPSEEHSSEKDEDEEMVQDSDEEEEMSDEASKVKDGLSDMASETDTSHQNEDSLSKQVYLRPPMRDAEVWTHQPEHDCYLHVRVYKPEELDGREFKCILTYGKQLHKTAVLDPLPISDESEETAVPSVDNPDNTADVENKQLPKSPSKKTTKGRKPGGKEGKKASASKSPATVSKPKDTHPGYEECVFMLPEEVIEDGTKAKDSLRIAVHYGPKEEMVAMATIDMEDLQSLDMPILHVPPPVGDAWTDEEQADSSPPGDKLERDIKEMTKEMLPVSFPVYPIGGDIGNKSDVPSGTLPLVTYIIMKQKPVQMNRISGTQTLQELVQDILGVDIATTTKEDLNKDMADCSLSPICFTPEPVEETVPKSTYEKMVTAHTEELHQIQQDYEQRLQDLANSMQQMQSAHLEREDALHAAHHQQLQQEIAARERTFVSSRSSRRSERRTRSPPSHPPTRTVSVVEPTIPEPSPPRSAVRIPEPKSKKRESKHFQVGKPLPNWGENIPTDFFERLAMFEEETVKRRQQLIETMRSDLGAELERKLAGEFKISKKPEELNNDILQDVSLPAVFLPQKSNNMMIFNPRAHKSFHPTGSNTARLTQPPSMIQLPPLPKNKMAVVNLFDMTQGFSRGGNEWLMQRYLAQQSTNNLVPAGTPATASFANTPGLQMASPDHLMNGDLPRPRTPAAAAVME